jgi:nucleoside-diphosphate-sugar epimerase
MLPSDPLIDRSSCLAVVPSYDEAATVGGLVSTIQRKAPQVDVLVIDDGSTDSTGACAEGAGARVLRLYFSAAMSRLTDQTKVLAQRQAILDAGEPPVIFGDGSQAYDFVHVADVARANIFALKSEAATDRNYDVGTDVKTTIKELLDALLEITGSDLEPDYRPQEQMFVTHRVGSTENAERDLGFVAEIPYEEGLLLVVEWRRSDQRRAVPEQA